MSYGSTAEWAFRLLVAPFHDAVPTDHDKRIIVVSANVECTKKSLWEQRKATSRIHDRKV